ncbi:MAG: multidrug effflux MFS transporter [Bacteroidales bacterium]|nr:multidrug effflux MFS transporter [Bacteroidales bacterium]
MESQNTPITSPPNSPDSSGTHNSHTSPGSSATQNSHSASESVDQYAHKSAMTEALASDKHYYLFLVTYLVLISALGSFVNDMYTPSLPAMCRFFGCQVPLAQMGLTMGMVGLATGQLILGPVSDRYGRKLVLFWSLLLFIIAAIVSVFSPTIHFFNTCRFFQGVGASGGYFLARTIPADIYSGRNLAKLMALIGGINGIAPASAPVIGGVTADHFGWKGVFVLLTIFAISILLLSGHMKESLPPSARVTGKWSKSLEGYLRLLSNRRFMTHVAFKGLALGMLFAYISATPFILQTNYGLSQTTYGLIIGFNALFVAAGSMVALKFHPLKKAASIGCIILMTGVAAEAIILYSVSSLLLFEVSAIVILFGLGLIFSTTNTLAMNEGRKQAGEASSVLGISGYIVGAVVSPLVGLGNILHSTANVFIMLALLTAIFAYMSSRIAPDLQN